MISTQEEWWRLGSRAWLGGQKKLFRKRRRPSTHTYIQTHTQTKKSNRDLKSKRFEQIDNVVMCCSVLQWGAVYCSVQCVAVSRRFFSGVQCVETGGNNVHAYSRACTRMHIIRGWESKKKTCQESIRKEQAISQRRIRQLHEYLYVAWHNIICRIRPYTTYVCFITLCVVAMLFEAYSTYNCFLSDIHMFLKEHIFQTTYSVQQHIMLNNIIFSITYICFYSAYICHIILSDICMSYIV